MRFPWQPRKTGRELLRPHELAILEAVRERLAPDARARFDGQLSLVRRVERDLDGRSITLRHPRGGFGPEEAGSGFPAVGREIRLATVRWAVAGSVASARLTLVGGWLFTIDIEGDPSSAIAPDVALVATLDVDPMSEVDVTATQLLGDLPDVVRREYDALLAARPRRPQLLPPDELYGIELPSGRHLVVGARDDGDLVIVPIGSADPRPIRIEPGDHPGTRYPTLSDALGDEDAGT